MAEVMDAKLESLDTLAAQIDRAADALARLKEQNRTLAARVKELEASAGELDGLRAAERQWTAERKEVAHRVEELIKKLERIEA